MNIKVKEIEKLVRKNIYISALNICLWTFIGIILIDYSKGACAGLGISENWHYLVSTSYAFLTVYFINKE